MTKLTKECAKVRIDLDDDIITVVAKENGKYLKSRSMENGRYQVKTTYYNYPEAGEFFSNIGKYLKDMSVLPVKYSSSNEPREVIAEDPTYKFISNLEQYSVQFDEEINLSVFKSFIKQFRLGQMISSDEEELLIDLFRRKIKSPTVVGGSSLFFATTGSNQPKQTNDNSSLMEIDTQSSEYTSSDEDYRMEVDQSYSADDEYSDCEDDSSIERMKF